MDPLVQDLRVATNTFAAAQSSDEYSEQSFRPVVTSTRGQLGLALQRLRERGQRRDRRRLIEVLEPRDLPCSRQQFLCIECRLLGHDSIRPGRSVRQLAREPMRREIRCCAQTLDSLINTLV